MADPTTGGARLGGVAETLLIPLYFRALESQRPDAILRDDRATAIVEELDYDFSQVRKIRVSEGNKVARFMLTRQLDRYIVAFLQAHPDGAVVHVGCGLDPRFERVDNGRVEWFDLDLPEVIALRRRFLGDERERYHLLACSVFDDGWRDTVASIGRPVLFAAEAVLVYFPRPQVRSLLVELCERFPGSELVFDGWSPLFVRLGNFQLAPSAFAGTLRWGLCRARSLERWAEGVRLLDTWGFFDQPEPRMAPYRWVAPLFRLFRPIRVLHYRLGDGARSRGL